MDVKELQIATFAFSSKVFILVLQFVANALIPDHDAGVFLPPQDKSQFSWLDHTIHFMFGGLQRWDAVYFTHIMQFGYTYQNCVAFFPFYPLVASSISSLLHIFVPLHYSSWILLTSVLLNLMLFVVTALMLHRLGKLVVNSNVATYGAMMFCINPASIFMTAPYSEIMYMFLLILALLKLHTGSTFTASFLIGLSVFTRSNGVIGTGFLLHAHAKSLIVNLQMLLLARKVNSVIFVGKCLYLILSTITNAIICLVLSLSPFFIYQFYIYQKFCLPLHHGASLPADLISYGRAQGYHLLGDDPPPWCSDHLPISYFYIQKHHWDVGFLQYYQVKQLPNFLLACPVFLLSVGSCLYFFQRNPQPFYTLGLVTTQNLHTSQAKSASQERNSDDDTANNCLLASNNTTKNKATKNSYTHDDNKSRRRIMREDLVIYVFHLMGLTLSGCFFIHIQVLTRLLCSSSPLLYWYCGALYVQSKHKERQNLSTKQTESSKTRSSTKAKTSNIFLLMFARLHLDFIVDVAARWPSLCCEFRAVFVYCIAYCVIGTVMFCNFFPWT